MKTYPARLVKPVPHVIPSPANVSQTFYFCWCALWQVPKTLLVYTRSIVNMHKFGCDRLETYCCLCNRAARKRCVSWSAISREPDYLTRSLRAAIRRESCQWDQVEKSGVPRIYKQKWTQRPHRALRFESSCWDVSNVYINVLIVAVICVVWRPHGWLFCAQIEFVKS